MAYRIVFQGGGANLFSFLAALKAVEDSVESNEIEIEALAGTSAGSIAALILGLGISSKAVIEHFRGAKGLKFVNALELKYGLLPSIAIVGAGRTLIGEAPLRNFLKEIISLKFPSDRLSQIEMKYNTKIIVSDIFEQKSVALDLSGKSAESIIDIVASSCALPFIFRNHKAKKHFRYADGGLIENLPVGQLMDGNVPARNVIAIGFDDIKDADLGQISEVEPAEKRPNFREYAKHLISSTIASNVTNSRRLIPEGNTLSLPTFYGVMDFREAFDSLYNKTERNQELQRLTTEFIKDVSARNSKIEANIDLKENSTVPADFQSLRKRCTNMIESRFTKGLRKRGVSYVEMNSLLSQHHPRYSPYDSYFHEFQYEIPEDGLECIAMGVSNFDTPEETNTLQYFEVFSEAGGALEFDLFPIDDISKRAPSEEINHVAILFRKKILPEACSKIRVVQKEFIRGGFPGLIDGPFGFWEYAPELVIYDELSLVFGLPQSCCNSYNVEVARAPYDKDSEGLKFVQAKRYSPNGALDSVITAEMELVGFTSTEPFGDGSALSLIISKR